MSIVLQRKLFLRYFWNICITSPVRCTAFQVFVTFQEVTMELFPSSGFINNFFQKLFLLLLCVLAFDMWVKSATPGMYNWVVAFLLLLEMATKLVCFLSLRVQRLLICGSSSLQGNPWVAYKFLNIANYFLFGFGTWSWQGCRFLNIANYFLSHVRTCVHGFGTWSRQGCKMQSQNWK